MFTFGIACIGLGLGGITVNYYLNNKFYLVKKEKADSLMYKLYLYSRRD